MHRRLLQRGRACEGAEIPTNRALPKRAPSFNGAAPVRARKCRGSAGDPRLSQCFNGAAPVRARKSASLRFGGAELRKLQRGRACEGAEMSGDRLAEGDALMLQRGRACEGAEMGRVTAASSGSGGASTGPRL